MHSKYVLFLSIVSCIGFSCKEHRAFEVFRDESKEKMMVILGIDLQEGFERDTVTIILNDKQVYRKENVTTKLLLGYADTFEEEAETGACILELKVAPKGLREIINLNLTNDTFLGIFIEGGKIKHRISEARFGYS